MPISILKSKAYSSQWKLMFRVFCRVFKHEFNDHYVS
ncbi:unnamed protein product [Arabidopsis halleri]